MIAPLLLTNMLATSFDADDLLREAGYEKVYHGSWSGKAREQRLAPHEKVGTWINDSDKSVIRIELSEFNPEGNLGQAGERATEKIRSASNAHLADDDFKSYSGEVIGVSNVNSVFHSKDGTSTIFAFNRRWSSRIVCHGAPAISETRNSLRPLTPETLLLLESWSRWRLSQMTGQLKPLSVQWNSNTYSGLQNETDTYLALEHVAQTEGWTHRSELRDTDQLYDTPRGALKVVVGSDAIILDGATARTGKVHPAKGRTIYIPIGYLSELFGN